MRHQTCTMLAIAGTLLTLAPVGPAAGQVACGDTITEDTVLDQDLDCGRFGGFGLFALTVEGPATLDLNGHVLTCNPSAPPPGGVLLDGTRARLVDGTVTGCPFQAVLVRGGGGHTVRDVTLTQNSVGILVVSSGNLIKRNSLEDNDHPGIQVSGSDNRLIGNHINGVIVPRDVVGVGILLTTFADSTTVIANVVTGMDDEGIIVQTNENTIRANKLSGNRIGILVSGQSNTLTGNIATGNDEDDLIDENAGCDDNDWHGNTFDSASSDTDCID